MTQIIEHLPIIGQLVGNGEEGQPQVGGFNKMPDQDDFGVGAVLCAHRDNDGDESLVIATKADDRSWLSAGLGLPPGPQPYPMIRAAFGMRLVWFASEWSSVDD